MQRVAFKMKLKPGCSREYEKRHDEIWPELAALLREAGISGYSIFLDEETDVLFAVQKLKDRSLAQDIGRHPVMKKWWKYMADLMDTHPDFSPVATPLKEVFYLD